MHFLFKHHQSICTHLLLLFSPNIYPGATPQFEHSTPLIIPSPPTSIPGTMPTIVESNIPILVHTPTPSLLPNPGTGNSPARESSAGAIVGALVGVMLVVVVAVLVVLVVVLVSRRRQKKQLTALSIEDIWFDNPVYEGTIFHWKHLYPSPFIFYLHWLM